MGWDWNPLDLFKSQTMSPDARAATLGLGRATPQQKANPSLLTDKPVHASPATPGFSAADAIGQYLGNYRMGQTGEGVDVGKVMSFLQATQPDAVSGLKSSKDVAKFFGTGGAGSSLLSGMIPSYQAQTPASGLDPIALQMFFQKAIQPAMHDLYAQEQQDVKGMPASVRGPMDTLMASEEQAMLMQPMYDRLMQQLAATQKQKAAAPKGTSLAGMP